MLSLYQFYINIIYMVALDWSFLQIISRLKLVSLLEQFKIKEKSSSCTSVEYDKSKLKKNKSTSTKRTKIILVIKLTISLKARWISINNRHTSKAANKSYNFFLHWQCNFNLSLLHYQRNTQSHYVSCPATLTPPLNATKNGIYGRHCNFCCSKNLKLHCKCKKKLQHASVTSGLM